jgi:hypothetical protein
MEISGAVPSRSIQERYPVTAPMPRKSSIINVVKNFFITVNPEFEPVT